MGGFDSYSTAFLRAVDGFTVEMSQCIVALSSGTMGKGGKEDFFVPLFPQKRCLGFWDTVKLVLSSW